MNDNKKWEREKNTADVIEIFKSNFTGCQFDVFFFEVLSLIYAQTVCAVHRTAHHSKYKEINCFFLLKKRLKKKKPVFIGVLKGMFLMLRPFGILVSSLEKYFNLISFVFFFFIRYCPF